jgi:hypothetical protein
VSIKDTQCLILLCDGCEDGYDDEGGPWHFPDRAAIRQYADDWLIDGDSAVCPRCQLKRVCAAEGHVWGAWENAFRGGQWRFCVRARGDYECSEHEERIP